MSERKEIGIAANADFRLENTLIKNLSLEIPENVVTPVFNKEPSVKLELRNSARPLSRDSYVEVVLESTVRVRNGDDLQLLVEVSQSGIFFVRHDNNDTREYMINVQAPEMLYPYLSQVVSEMMIRAGAPRVFLPPFDFKQVYDKKRELLRQKLMEGEQPTQTQPAD